MNRPFAAYEGDEPYVFVCYAHEDARSVYPEIQRLHEGGVRIWYDEGISPGMRWSDELARKLSNAALVLFFRTPQSVKSQHCQDELNFALDDKRALLVVQDGIYENVSLTYLLMMESSPEPVPMVASIEELLKAGSALLESGVRPFGLDQLHFDKERAQYALLKLDYAGASRYVREGLAANPGDAWALDLQTWLLLHQEQPDEALAATRRGVEILGTNPRSQLALARLLRARGQSQAAIKSLDSALEFYPGELGKAQLLIEQGNAYRRVGNAERAATLIDQAWDLCGSRHANLFPAALATTGRSDRARAILNDLEAAGHTRRINPLDMIEGYVALGDFDAAFRWINRAVDARFEPVVRWMHLVTVSVADVWPAALTNDPRWREAYAKLPKVEVI